MAGALGLDFGTTNTVLALADGGTSTHSMHFTSSAGVTDTMRTALSFMKDKASTIKAEAGKAAIVPDGSLPRRLHWHNELAGITGHRAPRRREKIAMA